MTRRSALPTPRYVERKPLKSGWGYFFNVPTWARRAGCPISSEALGVDYEAAVTRAEIVLLPAFDSWRSGGASDTAVSSVAAPGTLDWVFAGYRADRRFTKLDPKTRRNHEVGFGLVGGYQLKDGRRLGQARLALITTAVTDAVYEKLLIVTETDAGGNTVERERRTTVNHAMKTCRRAWNVAARRNPGKLPLINPFAKMGLRSSDRETPTATFAELQTFRTKAIEKGYASLATAALLAWEWLQREEDIFGTFDVMHYRPKERPNTVRIVHEKTREENWIPLFDAQGVPLYPELMGELELLKRDRIGGLMLRRDWGDRIPWPSASGDLSLMRHNVKKIIRAAGLRDALSFTSFRHGGFTEAADADLTDAEIRAQGRHKSTKVLPRYAKRTMKQVEAGAKKRRAVRTDGGHLSE
jgi:hypothetical protein